MKILIVVERSAEFDDWFADLTIEEQAQVSKRIEKIKYDEHLGDFKYIDDGLFELRWKNGWRVYFMRISLKEIMLLVGGHKNGQKKDIKKARLAIRRYANN